MSELIKINDPDEISRKLIQNSQMFEEYLSCIDDDLVEVMNAQEEVARVNEIVKQEWMLTKERLEAAKLNGRNSCGAADDIREHANRLSLCETYMRTLAGHNDQLLNIRNEIMNNRKNLENSKETHKSVQNKLCLIIEKYKSAI